MKDPRVDRFRVRGGRPVRLGKLPTRIAPLYGSVAEYERILAEHVARLSDLQTRLYAHDKFSLLLVFQAMDAAGKDGAIRHIMSGVNPQGCQVVSFKHPSAEDLDHDFLWRSTRHLPERGRIGIFNRSYYEEVLIVRVHPEILAAQRLPDGAGDDPRVWKRRFRSIVEHEAHLHRNGTRIAKFYLHVSKEEQRRRLLARLDDPDKHWKVEKGDVDERELWDEYRHAYEECLAATSTKHCPWYVVPADDKKNARLVISRIVVELLEGLDLRFPKPTAAQRRAISGMRRRLLRRRS